MAYEKLAVSVSSFFTVLSVAAWTFLISQSEGWLKKLNVLYCLDAGLFEVRVSQGVVSMATGMLLEPLSRKARDQLKHLQKGTFSLQEFREYTCHLHKFPVPGAGDICDIFGAVQLSSWALVFLLVLGLLLLASAGGMDLYYHLVRPRARLRKVVRILYSIAPMLFVIGVLQYCGFASRIADMPPQTEATSLGPNVMVAWFVCVLSAVPMAVVLGFGGQNLEELHNENISAHKKLMREVGMYQEYGAAPPGAAGGPEQASPAAGSGWAAAGPPQQQPFGVAGMGGGGAPQFGFGGGDTTWGQPMPPGGFGAIGARPPDTGHALRR